MMPRMTINLVQLLEEIHAHYKSSGTAVPQTEMAEALGVNQGTISKWLNRSRKPDRYAASIIALHHQLTGKAVTLPVVTGETDAHIRRVIEIMQMMPDADRARFASMAEAYLQTSVAA